MSERAMPWKMAALRRLAEDGAPRAFSLPDIEQWLAEANITPTLRTLHRALLEWEDAGLIARPVRGSYLNLRAYPQPTHADTAAHIRQGAVISLSSVLGRAGVLNNPTAWTTAVIPSNGPVGLPTEITATDGSKFLFAHLRPELLPVPGHHAWARDALEPYTPVPTATPEKALLDWVYLSTHPRSAGRWALPALHDLDVDGMDTDRLDRLARPMGLVDRLAQLRADIAASRPKTTLRSRLR